MNRLTTRWPWYVSLVPVALIATGIFVNLLSPRDYWGDYQMGAAVVLAGALLSLRQTIAVGAALVLAELALLIKDGYFGHPPGTFSLLNAVFTALVGLGVNLVVARHERRLKAVRSVAEAAQRAVLPTPPTYVGRLAIAAAYRTAQFEALIGGDAYAVQDTPYGTRLLIADVRGKGLGAVGTVSVLLGAFREAADQATDLVVLAERVERALVKEASSREEDIRMEGFVTAVLGEITPGADRVRLLNYGHPPPYLLEGDTVSSLDPGEPSLPLCMSSLGAPQPEPEDWPFPVGSTLLLVTDGVTEARDHSGTFYEPARRLGGQGPFRQPDEVVEALVRDVERWTGGPRDDDMAILAITRSA
ncbi:PP2C family protein-serine/threonine phosphatase [Nonomuraea sp. CA-141351]|uniref:PP2C family protein-serine/threonine phosphatase n=1 Tax=Nonomuraea sp. CA-141351 TaxID=3239996 RepID=UPI003D8B24F9